MIAAGARSRHVVVRGGAEAATGRMLGVAASCQRYGSQSNVISISRYLDAAIGNGRGSVGGLVVAAQMLSRRGQDKTPAMLRGAKVGLWSSSF